MHEYGSHFLKCLKCNFTTIHPNWLNAEGGICTSNMLMDKCHKCCNVYPNQSLGEVYWLEDGTPLGHEQPLPKKGLTFEDCEFLTDEETWVQEQMKDDKNENKSD